MAALIIIAVIAIMAFLLLGYLLWLLTGGTGKNFILGIVVMVILAGIFLWLFYIPLYQHMMESPQVPQDLEAAPTLKGLAGDLERYSEERLRLNLAVSVQSYNNEDKNNQKRQTEDLTGKRWPPPGEFVPGGEPELSPVLAVFYPRDLLEPVRASQPFRNDVDDAYNADDVYNAHDADGSDEPPSPLIASILAEKEQFVDSKYLEAKSRLSDNYKQVYLRLDELAELDSWEEYQSGGTLNQDSNDGFSGIISEEIYFQLPDLGLSENLAKDLSGEGEVATELEAETEMKSEEETEELQLTAVLLYVVDPSNRLPISQDSDDPSGEGHVAMPPGVRLIPPDAYHEYISDSEVVRLPIRELDVEVHLNGR